MRNRDVTYGHRDAKSIHTDDLFQFLAVFFTPSECGEGYFTAFLSAGRHEGRTLLFYAAFVITKSHIERELPHAAAMMLTARGLLYMSKRKRKQALGCKERAAFDGENAYARQSLSPFIMPEHLLCRLCRAAASAMLPLLVDTFITFRG